MNLVILGAPGSGKGTQAVRIADKAGIKHISSGELLRAAVSKKTDIGKRVEEIMQSGKLVPDETVLALVTEALMEEDARSGWILDGYPRTADQAEALEDVLSGNRELVDAVLLLDVSVDDVLERLGKRGRADDNPETVRKRMEVFEAENAPLLGFYELRYDVHRVNGAGTIDEVSARVDEILEL